MKRPTANAVEGINCIIKKSCKSAKDIPIQTRILTIIDIFDALTAFDRPYKPAISVEKAIGILNHDVDLGRIDKEILVIFFQKVILDKEGK